MKKPEISKDHSPGCACQTCTTWRVEVREKVKPERATKKTRDAALALISKGVV